MNHDHAQQGSQPTPFWRSRYSIGLIVFASIAAYFLLSEHRVHFFGVLPIMLLLACPLMHFFMHKGHGTHGGIKAHQPDGKQTPVASTESQVNKSGERA